MSNFELEYLGLLKTQVMDEMDFLQEKGHTDRKPSFKCPFCQENSKGELFCVRMQDLREFRSNITVTMAMEWQKTKTKSKAMQPVEIIDC